MITITTTNPEKQKSLEDELYPVGLLLLSVAAVVIPVLRIFVLPWMDSLPLGCAFWTFLGVYCPGCGGTRAVKALLDGHLLESLWYHPLVMYGVVLYFSLMISWTFAKLHLFGIKRGLKFRAGYFYGMLVVIAVNFILKNVLKFCFGIVMY